MSTSAVSAAPPPSSSSPSTAPPRASRPPHPRPTTYTGPSSTTASHSTSASASYNNNGPPIPPPPRTSSKTHIPVAVSSHPTATSTTASTAPGTRRGNSRGGGNGGVGIGSGGGDGQQDRDRDRSDRDRDRERDRDRADRERRKAEEGKARQQDYHVGRSNSVRVGSGGGASGSRSAVSNSTSNAPQPVERQASSRRRQDSAEGTSSTKPRAAGSSNVHALSHHNGEETKKNNTTRKETRFGEYVLGQTLGEGEFGKVKLGWRRDGGVQVAIKLIRRDSVSPHPNRLSKIYREIAILRTLSHPNIVRLHEMVETDRHIGIILEYASGGELFDYILTHRYLKDPPACRLFAQLVSGVGYLHKKGIVHRDLKLENLLLDRNRNIIITDFGFANVFDPTDELGELEDRMNEPDVIKELEKGIPHTDRKPDGSSLLSIIGPGQTKRRGDLMATSCGSPCYAAPELVVSDGLYTGRKVDVWSCGVILYAMLAGYLPFDDDPANPEGDNINLLYKYIVSTPLTFPEYVTPHARDLLRRILVPDPRKRADLFEVARHSWLSPFADIVNKVTSATTGIKDVETITVREPKQEAPVLTRSASVREPTSHAHTTSALGNRYQAHEYIPQPTQSKPSSDAKRRTVQVEYVEPQSQTKRGSSLDTDAAKRSDEAEDAAPAPVVATHKDNSGVSRSATTAGTARTFTKFMDKQKARDLTRDETKFHGPEKGKARPVSYQYQQSHSSSRNVANADGAASTSPSRRTSRGGSGSSKQTVLGGSGDVDTRPNTANSLGSNRLPSRGRIAMPKTTKPYQISNPIPQSDSTGPDFATSSPRPSTQPEQQVPKGHKRANTVGGIGGDSGRVLSKIMGASERQEPTPRPPVVGGDSRQSNEHGWTKNEKHSSATKSRRFSLLPASFSFRSISGSESKHERKLSKTSTRQYGQPQSQPPPHQAQSQPHLSVPGTDGASAMTGSDTSLAAGSAPASSFIDMAGAATATKKTTLGKHKKFGDAYEGELSSGGHGSSGPARRVMDFFRLRGTARSKGNA